MKLFYFIIKQKYTRTRAVLLFLLLFSCSTPKTEDDLKIIDLEHYYKSSGGLLSIEDRYNEWFSDYNGTFIENTDSNSISQIRNLIGVDSSIVILMGEKLRFFDRSSGKELYDFQPQKNENYFSFDIDKKNRILYVLNGEDNQICCYDFHGELYYTIPIESGYHYDKLLLLDDSTLLLTVLSLPNKVTFVVDLKSKCVKALDLPGADSFTPSEIELNLLSSMGPLYFTSRCDTSGVYVKYLFDDMVYKYSVQGSKPIYEVKSDKKLKYKKGISEKGKGNLIFNGLWNLSDGKFLIKYRVNIKKHDRQMCFFTIANNDMDLYNNTLTYNSACMEWRSPYQDIFKSMETNKEHIFDITPESLLYIQNDDKMIYRIISFRKDYTILPAGFHNPYEKNGLILSHFQLRR